MQESFRCTICFEVYTDARKPITLVPCGHDLCEGCSNRIAACPQCRQRIISKVLSRGLLAAALAFDGMKLADT